ncbi:MAG: hypothetical protein P4L41_07060 [Flavipsychrobacter sp.]|nr:hypothetical protein [Flavipsychrobacter sp.]
MRIAIKKLVETSAANNESLIVGDENGNPISVPAKELLNAVKNYETPPDTVTAGKLTQNIYRFS